ncbi:MAG: hypothetical protein IT480_06545 [Gammaproteobacteria bacterium]|nr:hypothetical protein [Gammaproteobacteria bacterium]
MSQRDGRALSAMSEDTKLVHARLEEWARYVRGDGQELGLPPETYLYRWAKYGVDGAAQAGKPPTMPDRIAAVDTAVARLAKAENQIVRTYYLSWAPRETMARNCGIGLHQFDGILRRARWRIAGFLEASAKAEI